MTHIVEVETGVRVRTGFSDPITLRSSDRGLSAREHRSIVAAIVAHRDPTLADLLLADAEHLLAAEVPQCREAVLLAAIACEVGIRSALRSACPAEAAPLLEFALANPRDVSVQAAALFDKASAAAIGRSLRVENRSTYVSVTRLFEARNGVAHRGESPAVHDPRAHVSAARDALDWAASLTDDGSGREA